MQKQVQIPFLKGTVIQTSAINRDSGAFHGGNDYSVPIGTPIQSGASGTVIWSGYNPTGHGYAVVVKDANGNSMLYSHMGTAGNPPANMPAVGTEVKAGDTIGTVGNTGQVQISNGGGVLHVTAFDQTYTEQIRQSGASMSDPQTNSNSLGVSSNPKLSNGEPNKAGQGHILNPDAYMQDNPELFKPSDVSPVATTGASGDNTTNPNHTSDYNFPNTAGGGRGSVNPDGVQPSDSSPEPSDSDSDVSQQIKDAFNQADQSAADIKAKYPDSIQVADASGALPDTSAQTNTNTFSNYLDTQGSGLSAKQQDALAAQIDKLGLGGEAALSFYPLPTGSTVIANADGEIVGEIKRSSTGELNLKATAIDGNGNSVEVNNHISEQGNVITDAAKVQQQASNMFNSLMAVNNWDHLSDVGKLSALVNLYNATDKLQHAQGAIAPAWQVQTVSDPAFAAANDDLFRSVA